MHLRKNNQFTPGKRMGGGTRKSAVEEVILILHLLFHYQGTLGDVRLDWWITDVNDRLGTVASVRRFMNLRRFCFCETIRIFKAAHKGWKQMWTYSITNVLQRKFRPLAIGFKLQLATSCDCIAVKQRLVDRTQVSCARILGHSNEWMNELAVNNNYHPNTASTQQT